MVQQGTVEEGSVFQAPTDENTRAGTKTWTKLMSPYDRFMQEEGIPVVRGIGINDVRELPREPWKRLGGRGYYVQLDGTDWMHGMFVVEVPARGSLNPERHIYEANFYVVEGRGSTEVWYEGSSKNLSFEWQTGSLFTIPLNSYHRLINAGSSPAILIGMTTAPNSINEYPSRDFIFENPYQFAEFGEDYYKPREELELTSYSKRAARRTNFIPDLLTCELPLDNQRLPGFRRIEPYLGSGLIFTFVWEYPSGRYSRGHGHSSGAIIICLKGRAYTMNWPASAGSTPWKDGQADLVNRTDYKAGGMVTAAPGGGAWYHQHFACSKEMPRFLIFAGSHFRGGQSSVNRINNVKPGEEYIATNVDAEEGGGSISYRTEDPEIRKIYEAELAREGAKFTMPEDLFV